MILQNHRLGHLPGLRVDPGMFEQGFVAGCSMANCDATCCRAGVYVDVKERDRILAHADLVRRHMDAGQQHDSAEWFESDEEPDADFPSGVAVGTRVRGKGCVFLNSRGHCVLQIAGQEEGLGKFSLKPFYCVAYPVTIEHGVVMIDDADFTNRRECCSCVPGGPLRVFDVCREELEFVLGPSGAAELEQAASRQSPRNP